MAYKVLAKRLGFKWDQCDPSNLSWELAQLKDYTYGTIFVYVTVCNETGEDQQTDGKKEQLGSVCSRI